MTHSLLQYKVKQIILKSLQTILTIISGQTAQKGLAEISIAGLFQQCNYESLMSHRELIETTVLFLDA